MSDRVYSVPRKLDPTEREAFISGSEVNELVVPVDRKIGPGPVMNTLDSLMTTAHDRQRAGDWPDRATSDRWLAPRVHFALRLLRSEASDRGLWQWIALRYPWYVEWRWQGRDRCVANDRWWGPIHKQAFARLWWGAEIFRDGGDYRSVERAFIFQDLPNSYLHRPVVRCRSLALAIIDQFEESNSSTSQQINGLAKVLNLATAGSPPEVETGFQNDDLDAYSTWAAEDISAPVRWERLPPGPSASDTTDESRAGGVRVVQRGWIFAGFN